MLPFRDFLGSAGLPLGTLGKAPDCVSKARSETTDTRIRVGSLARRRAERQIEETANDAKKNSFSSYGFECLIGCVFPSASKVSVLCDVLCTPVRVMFKK